jgi:hypothetical protein
MAGFALRKGQRLKTFTTAPAGTYLYICRRKGHAIMTGTLLVE